MRSSPWQKKNQLNFFLFFFFYQLRVRNKTFQGELEENVTSLEPKFYTHAHTHTRMIIKGVEDPKKKKRNEEENEEEEERTQQWRRPGHKVEADDSIHFFFFFFLYFFFLFFAFCCRSAVPPSLWLEFFFFLFYQPFSIGFRICINYLLEHRCCLSI